MKDFCWFLELCAGNVLLEVILGANSAAGRAKVWIIAHADICGYSYCNLINGHNEF